MKKNKKNLIILSMSFFMILFFTVIYLEPEIFTKNYKYYSLILFFNFFVILYLTIKKHGIFNIYTLFVYTFFLFLLSIYFFDLFNLADLRQSNLFSRIYLDSKNVIKSISVLIIVINCFYIVSSNHVSKNVLSKWKSYMPYSDIAFKLMLLLSPTIFIFLYNQLLVILSSGYISIFNGVLRLSIFEQYIIRLYYFLYIFVIAFKPKKKVFLISSLLFYSITFLDLVQGQRGLFLSYLLVSVILYFSYYKVKINLRSILLVFLAFILLSQFILSFRQGYSSGNIFDIIKDFHLQNGISTYVLSYSIRFSDSLNEITNWFFLSPINDYFYRLFIDRGSFYSGQSLDLLLNSNYLGYQLTNIINQAAFLYGNGTGTSFVAEILLLDNIFLSIIFYIIYFRFFTFIYKLTNKYKIIRPIFVLLSIEFIYSPRSSYIKSFSNIILIILFYYIFNFVIKLIYKEKILVHKSTIVENQK